MRNKLTVLTAGIVIALAISLGELQARAAPESFADLAAKLLPAVVNISSTTTSQTAGPDLPQFPPGSPFEDFFRDFFERGQPQQRQRSRPRPSSLGSGFIIDKAGLVVTNNHVIQDAAEITVILQDDTRLKAELVGRDAKSDLAVLRVKPGKDLPFVPWGNSDVARVGDWVVAIGNPFGLGGSVTAGIVSARGRDINSGLYDDFIQTDAAINKGNSGGPLFNMEGHVIGINTAIFSPTGGSIGIGFAVPSATARGIVSQLIRYGHTRRGWLGVRIQEVTPEIAESLGLEKAEGALVATVTKDSPAAKGKIKAGDVVLNFNGIAVETMKKLPRIVAETEIDKPVAVEIWRDRKKVTVEITVGELQEEEARAVARARESDEKGGDEQKIETLGLTLSRLDSKVRKRFKLGASAKGVVVTAVDPKGVAAEKQLRPGDRIVEVSQSEVHSPAEVSAKIAAARQEGRKSVLLLLEGQNGLRFVALRIVKREPAVSGQKKKK